MIVVLVLCMVILSAAALLLVYRIAMGPSVLDRIIGFDVLVAVSIAALALEAAVHRHTTTLPILIVLTLLGFVGSTSVASFTRGSQYIEEDRS